MPQIVPVAYYADIIATKCRDLVYSEDSDGGAPSVSSASDQPTNMTYDPLALTNRIEGATDCESSLFRSSLCSCEFRGRSSNPVL